MQYFSIKLDSAIAYSESCNGGRAIFCDVQSHQKEAFINYKFNLGPKSEPRQVCLAVLPFLFM